MSDLELARSTYSVKRLPALALEPLLGGSLFHLLGALVAPPKGSIEAQRRLLKAQLAAARARSPAW
eukprot:3621254-Pleurochrysis_carterae.AAC.1